MTATIDLSNAPSPSDRQTVIGLPDRLDVHVASDLQAEARSILQRCGASLVLDGLHVRHIDHAGIDVIRSVQAMYAREGASCVVLASTTVRVAFELTGYRSPSIADTRLGSSMRHIELTGDLGPVEALDLRDQLDRATAQVRPQLVLDLSTVGSIHPAVVAAIVRASRRARRAAGHVHVIAPLAASPARTLGLVSMQDIL